MAETKEPGDPLAVALFSELFMADQLARARLAKALPGDMELSHFSVLNHLMRVSDGQTPLRIARAFQVPKTTMTHTLAGLDAKGFITFRPNPRDGRSKCVWLTDAGREFRDHARTLLEGDFQRLVVADEISPDSCRLWDIETGQKLDKDVFRRDLGNLTDAYSEVARRLGVMPKNVQVAKPTLIN